MRRLRRSSVVVPTLSAEGVAGERRASHIQAYEQNGRFPSTFPEHWTKPDVRGALAAMQGRVCAYCGADISEAGIDVEHFRPKAKVDREAGGGGYWWLAYVFENYVLSCTVCNQKCKRNKFPLAEGTVRVTYEARDQLSQEPRVLLDPTVDPVEDWLTVDWQDPLCRVTPNPNLQPHLVQRAKDAIEFFRLNRKPAQIRKRLAIQQLVAEKLEQNEADEISELAIRYRPHSIVAYQMLDAIAPDALPSPEDELQWLLNELSKELLTKLEILENATQETELDKNEARELMWALAVLWKDPPVGTAQEIAGFLERLGLKPAVADYLALL